MKVAQIGTKHGHAAGVYQVMLEHPGVEVVGCYEPDVERQAFCAESGGWEDAIWLDSIDEILDNPEIVAVASEGANRESLAHTEAIVRAGKHCFYDKPAGDDFHRFMRVIEDARDQDLQVTLGYMFRKHDGFERMANWVRTGIPWATFSRYALTCPHGCLSVRRAGSTRTGRGCLITEAAFSMISADTCSTRSYG